jgi:hypothetical protein
VVVLLRDHLVESDRPARQRLHAGLSAFNRPAQSLSAFRAWPSRAPSGARSRLSPDTNSPENCWCLAKAKARACGPWRNAPPRLGMRRALATPRGGRLA